VVENKTKLMTTEELLALPDDGVERWLIDGELWENGMTVRNRFHSEVLINVGFFLKMWLRHQPEPRGKIYGGEAGVILSRNPDVTVCVDVVYVPHDVIVLQTDRTTLIEGIPTLAVEVSSPADLNEVVSLKIQQYLRHGVSLVWIVDPAFETVTIHERGQLPRMVNISETLSADPYLPGFSVSVLDLFRG
jgi:Uma2 family endonuclease